MTPNRHNTWFFSCLLCAGILIAFGVAEAADGSERLVHWFVIPVALCGILVLEDVVKWLQGDLDVFDPIGIVGLFGVHFFFLAPLLHVRWDFWMSGINAPADWRPWLGNMAAWNFVGLLAYRAARSHFSPATADETPSVCGINGWRLRPRRFVWVLGAALLLAGALQFWVFMSYGGVWSYISAVEDQTHVFMGSSRIATVSESFPILALIGFAVYVSWRRKTLSWPLLISMLVAFGVLKILFGGLHGSRSNTVFAMFWAAGIVHFGIRPVPRKLMLGGVCALVAFMYVYGFYKSGGVDALQQAFHSSQSRADVVAETGRPIESTLLGDLGRSDVQAFVLSRVTDPDSDYQLAFGRSYVGGLLTPVPGPLWRNRPATKVKEGTEALYGRGTYRERALSSAYEKDKYVGKTSRVFGLAGETLLNFGPLGIPVAFAVFGVVVGLTRRVMVRWSGRDPRRFLVSALINLCLVILIGDSDNVVVFLEGKTLFPFLVLFAASKQFSHNVQPAAAGDGTTSVGTVFGLTPLEEY